MNSRRSAEELSLSERKVLAALGSMGGKATISQLSDATGLKGPVQIMNALNWLKAKGYIFINERLMRVYTPRKGAPEKLPERILLELLSGKSDSISQLSSRLGDSRQLGVGIGWLRKKGWVKVDGDSLTLTQEGRRAFEQQDPEELELQHIREEGSVVETHENAAVLRNLLSRKDFVDVKEVLVRDAVLLDKGWSAFRQGIALEEELSQLTPELLRTGSWRNFRFRHYNMDAPVPQTTGARLHPIARAVREVSEIFLSMGFTEIEDEYVQSAFWDMDALFTPQDHPARDMQDTFYLSDPSTLKVEEDVLERVKRAHERGGNTGSVGWGYAYSREEGERALLRTHNTVSTIRYLASHREPPVKAFAVGRIFRHEAMDATHLSEFYQIEGVVMEKGASLDMLCGILTEFYRRMGMERIRLRPGYFPYTEPSMEVDVRFNGKWIELGGSGLFRPEVLSPLGIRHPVLAWGLGLERLVMLKYGFSDVRELYISDISRLRKLPLI